MIGPRLGGRKSQLVPLARCAGQRKIVHGTICRFDQLRAAALRELNIRNGIKNASRRLTLDKRFSSERKYQPQAKQMRFAS
jgi:hypothetical protein